MVVHDGYVLEDLVFRFGVSRGGQDWQVYASGSGAGYSVRIPGLTRTHNPERIQEADLIKYQFNSIH